MVNIILIVVLGAFVFLLAHDYLGDSGGSSKKKGSNSGGNPRDSNRNTENNHADHERFSGDDDSGHVDHERISGEDDRGYVEKDSFIGDNENYHRKQIFQYGINDNSENRDDKIKCYSRNELAPDDDKTVKDAVASVMDSVLNPDKREASASGTKPDLTKRNSKTDDTDQDSASGKKRGRKAKGYSDSGRKVDIFKEKGNDFESFVADVMKSNRIRILEWNQGTVTAAGAMGENALRPDFFVEQEYGKGKISYWLECKWRTNLDTFTFPESQIERYRHYQRERRRKVFIVFGTGKDPRFPEFVYVVPLDEIKGNVITREEMEPFYHKDMDDEFFARMCKYYFMNVFRKKNEIQSKNDPTIPDTATITKEDEIED